MTGWVTGLCFSLGLTVAYSVIEEGIRNVPDLVATTIHIGYVPFIVHNGDAHACGFYRCTDLRTLQSLT